MHLTFLFSLALAFFTSLAIAVDSITTVEVFVWPLSAAKSQSLASISFNSTTANLLSYTTPKFASNDEVVRVGFYHPSGSWSGIATSASNFAAEKDKQLRLLLNADDKLYHLGFAAYDRATGLQATKKTQQLDVKVEKMMNGPTPQLNKPIALKADGTADTPEPEKTFFQKYWWVVGAFLLVQVVLGGKGGE